MKLGICTEIDNIEIAKKSGCDYIEINFTTLTNMDDTDFDFALIKAAGTDIDVYSANCFIPGDFQLTGNDSSLKGLDRFIEKGMHRAKQLGIKIVVFGSGGARQVPEGYPMDKAYQQLKSFLFLAVPIADKYGIRIAIEPLATIDCNIINMVADGLKLADMVDKKNVGGLADLYHMGKNGDAESNIKKAGAKMFHTHIAYPETRHYPLPGDGYDYTKFFDNLKQIGYEGGVSIEGSADDFETELEQSIAYLRKFV